ncbi:hypothetical protein COEREDRAFT_81927 [Coemansia reversa NRRL 1564]|uniref:TFG box profile domain-containing protein n=1 Tax=Coemansia reversa (strain ATCC 12441 / NRRL 1564) TaxID=763665 RepID=A0A2G5B9E5_COERN|nr:hypothetical protein COEREDRAFT_81927 [Coemansia reversa NRRL 1564]|eukprot:PIA15602.1 hypothetical protein COEREDRAFT_81927 [Coemansia reversa NRRL 1564]
MFDNRISLITKSYIRYVGTLKEVDSEKSTILLEKVRSMGTEGRQEAPRVVPMSNDIYEFIQFRATDVQFVEFEKESAPAAPAPQIPNDPAILQARAQPTNQGLSPTTTAAASGGPSVEPVQVAPTQQGHPTTSQVAARQAAVPSGGDEAAIRTQQETPRYQQGGYVQRGGYVARGARGGYNNRGNGARRGGYQGRGGYNARQGQPIEVPESDFDFETSNRKLNKEDLAKEFSKLNVHMPDDDAVALSSADGGAAGVGTSRDGAIGVEAKSGHSYTPKSSFFDNISCESKERMQMSEGGMSIEERRSKQHAERQQNVETFGQASAEQNRLRYNRYHSGMRGGSGGGWRGGRGGRGGYNRGGYRGNGYRNQEGREYYPSQQQQQQDGTGAGGAAAPGSSAQA